MGAETLLQVFCRLIHKGVALVVIGYYLDAIRDDDYVIDMRLGLGIHREWIIAKGMTQDICNAGNILAGEYLKHFLQFSVIGRVVSALR